LILRGSPCRGGSPIFYRKDGITSIRELTRGELRDIRRLAADMCANYDSEYGCLLLDGKCYMFYGVAYNNSALCKYFRKAVLPLEPKLEAIFDGGGNNGDSPGSTAIYDTPKKCAVCGKPFYPSGRGRYCSEVCRAKSKRAQDRDSLRKYRKNKGRGKENTGYETP